ncbi:MAG: hypothetical protein HC878_18885 [Leptolyngbyaceae cyanobacterium SL_5_14]|nr:hypothetical protein [Leptolyngbyaceae cyanobacterium SL_5_14]
MSKKIKRTKVPKTSASGIRSTKLKPQGISFSFKYYQDGHNKFSCNGKAATYWLTLIDRLKALSGLSNQELLVNRSSTLRCHPIRWEDTSENGFGLPNEEQLVDTPYQFSLSSNEHGRGVHPSFVIGAGEARANYKTKCKIGMHPGRVHGFLIDEVFYIVWLDPDHLLYRAQG